MRIGYPCVNLTIGCSSGRTFRLASYSEERLSKTVSSNLNCLNKVLRFNAEKGILFFRITSDLVPFASHPVCRLDWGKRFRDEFAEIGEFIEENSIRISMHPDQFVLINAKDEGIVLRSIKDLEYHSRVLDLLGLDTTAKVQIHMGGVYGDRRASMERFVRRYLGLDEAIRKRLVVENDDINYSLMECLDVSSKTGVPVLFDSFHHSIRGKGEGLRWCIEEAGRTWGGKDGLPMIDYSTQEPRQRRGRHATSLDRDQFRRFLEESKPYNFDVMLEVKDKERSAVGALALARGDLRCLGGGGQLS